VEGWKVDVERARDLICLGGESDMGLGVGGVVPVLEEPLLEVAVGGTGTGIDLDGTDMDGCDNMDFRDHSFASLYRNAEKVTSLEEEQICCRLHVVVFQEIVRRSISIEGHGGCM
jgi:hypothetical protein